MSLDKYLDMSDEQIDNLLMGLSLNSVKTDGNKKNQVCANCKSSNLILDISNFVCTDCGMISGEYLNENPDIPNGENEASASSRYGSQTSFFFPKASMGTKIATKGFNRLSLIQRQGQMPYKEKNLMGILDIIQSKCKKYNITQPIIDCAKILYKKITESVHTKGVRKGKNIIRRCVNKISMIAACLFNACKMQKETRSPKEVADIYNIEVKHVNRGCRKFNDIIDPNILFNQARSSQSADFIERFAKKLGLEDYIIKTVKNVSDNIHKLNLASTHEPPSIAAACFLLVCEFHRVSITKKQIGEVFEISDVTIAKAVRKIWNFHKILMDSKIVDLILQKKNLIMKTSYQIDENNLVIHVEKRVKPIRKTKKTIKKTASDSSDGEELEIIDISSSDISDDEEIQVEKKPTLHRMKKHIKVYDSELEDSDIEEPKKAPLKFH